MRKHHFILIGIFLLACIIRLWSLETLPANFHEDEVLVGYVGRFIVEFGRDVYGNAWPMWYFDKFGDYYIIGPFYLSGLATLVWGMTAFAVRFPTAFLSALTVLPLYGFTEKLSSNRRIALLAAFFLAILPWHVVLSRSSAEGVLGAFFSMTGLYFLISSLQKNTVRSLLMALIAALAGYWIYHPYRVYAPFFFLGFAIIFYKKFARINTRLMLALCILTTLGLTVWISTTAWGRGRLTQTSIFGEISGVGRITQELIYTTKSNNLYFVRALHNKPINFAREFIRQYVSYFNPQFLFFDVWGEKYKVPQHGLLYLSFGVFLLVFLLTLHTQLSDKTKIRSMLFYLMALSFTLVPAAMTYIGSPNINRSAMFGVLLMPACGYGAYALLQYRNRIPALLLTGILCLEMISFGSVYYFNMDSVNALRRQDGVKELVKYIALHPNVDFYVPSYNTFGIYYPFYMNLLRESFVTAYRQEVRIDRIDNVHFYDVSFCPSDENVLNVQPGDMIAVSYTCGDAAQVKKFTLRAKIIGVDSLLGYRVYERLP